MKYFDYIFISGYRAYRKKETMPRSGGISLMLALLGGYFILIGAVSKKIWGMNPFLDYLRKYPVSIYIVAGLVLFLLNYYYSTDRTQHLDEEFENLPIGTRKLWGWITVLSIIIPYTVGVCLGIATSQAEIGI